MGGLVGKFANARVVANVVVFGFVAAAASAFGVVAQMSPADASGCGTQTAWTTFGFDNARTGVNPCETTLSTATVPNLHLLWTAPLSGVSVAQPTYAPGIVVKGVARNLLFVADEQGHVQAIDTATGKWVWRRTVGVHRSTCFDVPGGRWGASAAPLLDPATGTGYVVGGGDRLFAIDLATGRNKVGWTPVTIGKAIVDHVYGALTMSAGVLYVTTASYCDQGTYFGKVVAVSVATHSILKTWNVVDPNLNPGQYGGGIWGPGGVSVDNANGAVYAATGNALPGENTGYGDQVVRLDPSLNVQAANYTALVGTDVDYGATPLLFQPPGCPAMLAAKNKSGVLVVYNRDNLTAGPIQTIQIGDPTNDQFNGIPAYSSAQNMVYVTNSSQSPDLTYAPGMVAFQVQPDCTLSEAWHQDVGLNGQSVTPPTVANGVVYEGDGPDNTLWAFDAQTGAHLWDSGTSVQGMIFAAPTVVDGHVYAAAWDGNLYAFGT